MNLDERTSSRLGIVGGGQLGKMLALSASTLGIEVLFLDPSKLAVAQHVAKQLHAPFDDSNSLKILFEKCHAVTFEFENVSLDALKNNSPMEKLAPNVEALFVANDRLREKEFFQNCGLEVAPFIGITDSDKLTDQEFLSKVSEAAQTLGYPLIMKTCSLGYDGKGQVSLNDAESLAKALELKSAKRLIVEKKVSFNQEISVLAARGRSGEIVVYPTPQNIHRNGILFSSAVAQTEPNEKASEAIQTILNKLDYVGVLALELFEVNGKYLANEMAPRVHNTGHWTIEGAITSQFENHVRAVMGLPLGSPELRFPTAMFNIIGTLPDSLEILKIPGAHLHLYGKEPRPGRKLGHITIEAKSSFELEQRMMQVARHLHGLTL